MKLIFLDFDGVLVNRRSFTDFMRIKIPESDASYNMADPACVRALNRIVKETGASIVVSSTWRLGQSLIRLREILTSWGVDAKVIGKTPHLQTIKGRIVVSQSRGREIQTWLDGYDRNPVEKFVILDDDSDMEELQPFHLQTKFDDGLEEEHADRAIQMLR